MKPGAAALVAALALGPFGAAAPARAGTLAVEPGEVEAIMARLAGHTVRVAADRRSIAIDDAAGEGAPYVGVVEREGDHLVLVTTTSTDAVRWRLTGPLARPRIAGPGYTLWIVGDASPGAIPLLAVRRAGILRRPAP